MRHLEIRSLTHATCRLQESFQSLPTALSVQAAQRKQRLSGSTADTTGADLFLQGGIGPTDAVKLEASVVSVVVCGE